MIHGIIDIGSNTIRLNVYQINENNNFEILFSKKEAVGIVSYVKKRIMSEEGILKLEQCLIRFKEMMHALNIGSFSAFATALSTAWISMSAVYWIELKTTVISRSIYFLVLRKVD